MGPNRRCLLGVFWTLIALLGHLGKNTPSKGYFGRAEAVQESQWWPRGALGVLLGTLWGALGRLPRFLVRPWGVLGCSWGDLGRYWAAVGCSWGVVGTVLGRSQVVWVLFI